MNVKIKDKAALIKIFKTISWLDSRRWNTKDNYNIINFFKKDITNCNKILAHWICYITDRQMPFEIVWDKGGYVFSEIVYEYSRNKMLPRQILDKHYEKYQDKQNKARFRFKSTDDVTFASRYVTDDYQNILQTFEILDKYERNIIVYIVDIIKRFKNKDDLLVRVACALHLMTYQLDRRKANPQKVIEIIRNNNEFEKKLDKFKKSSTTGKKRLWCCVRDYKKGLYYELFKDAIEEVVPNSDKEKIINVWIDSPMDQIELPGDVWNNSPLFRDNLFAKVLDLDSFTKNWGMPKIIRELYNQLKNDEEVNGFYPEQFDVTFDFVPRMCDKKLCNICLFGKNGIELTCIPTKDKYCPVSLLNCGYTAMCIEAECILRKGISRGICKRI